MHLDLVVQIDNMQDIQELTFVLVKSLNLYIEDGVRVYFYAIVLEDVFSQTLFVLELDRHEFFQGLFVIQPFFQSAHLG